MNVFKELAAKIEASTTEYKGTPGFKGHSICTKVDEEKTSDILIGGEDKEFGTGMSQTKNPDLHLNLQNHDWYMYDENFGTSEEKHFIQFIRQAIDHLKKKYKDIYLLRNERLFKIYRFCDGQAMEPDFVLFLTEKKTKQSLSFQLFIEPKGQHLIKSDQWKEYFLKEIEDHFEILGLFETDKYRLVGLPFYNEVLKKQEFQKRFKEILNIPL